ncbi:hypothetical protein BpHYR1_045045 [Brachionus plicatilis]|uniref:Uncharacterized protein n=1 Tax=Brachionus plicatilis TaxID=10195 RepID=A0A3M7QKP3_BRAPC|nr:hypothetical protein BpHYR1_045045 [Brachionus plicatilis]
MPNQITKLLEKAKSKFSTGFCGTQDHMNQSTYISVTKVNVVTPVKINPKQKTLKKSVARANLFNDKSIGVCDQSTINISQFPLLISTPERNKTLESITQFDSTGSEIFESNTSDYGSNVSTAYSNVLYESPQCRQNTTPFSQMEVESFDRLLVIKEDLNSCYVKNVLTNECVSKIWSSQGSFRKKNKKKVSACYIYFDYMISLQMSITGREETHQLGGINHTMEMQDCNSLINLELNNNFLIGDWKHKVFPKVIFEPIFILKILVRLADTFKFNTSCKVKIWI